jgi:hypothetical protein
LVFRSPARSEAEEEVAHHPPAPPSLPPPTPPPPDAPESPPKASMRWASLKLPEQCFMFPSAPHGVLPGLEHYTFGSSSSATSGSHAALGGAAHGLPHHETSITVLDDAKEALEAALAQATAKAEAAAETVEPEEEEAEAEEEAVEPEEEEALHFLADSAEQSHEAGGHEAPEAAAELAAEERVAAVDAAMQEGGGGELDAAGEVSTRCRMQEESQRPSCMTMQTPLLLVELCCVSS